MTKSIETVLEKVEEAAGMVMLTSDPKLYEQLITPAIDEAVDSIYDYLQNPDAIEISMLQMELAPIAASLPSLIQNQAAQRTTVMTGDAAKLAARLGHKIADASKVYTTPRMRAAFEKASGGQSFDDYAQIYTDRLAYAASSGTYTDLQALNQTNTQQNIQRIALGMVGLAASEKLVPFMQALVKNLSKKDFSDTVHYLIGKGLQIKTGIEGMVDGLEDDSSALGSRLSNDRSLSGQLKAGKELNDLVQKEVLDGISNHFNITAEGAATTGRILSAIEVSLISSGAMTEAQYETFLADNYGKAIRAARGYDEMHGFTPKL